jgi:CSLREA domain-containing protein
MFKTIITRLIALLVLTLAASASFATSAVIVVNSTADTMADDGHCTLREAIIAADMNSNSGNMAGECVVPASEPTVQTISFDIPDIDPGCAGTPKVCTIKPADLNWPKVTRPVTINGYSQHGASVNSAPVGDDAVILIELDASNLTQPAIYLSGPLSGGDSSGSTIQGLVISHIGNGTSGICATCYGGGSDNHIITGNFIGTNAAGTATTSPNAGNAVDLNGSTGTVIGGTTPDKRNVMAAGGGPVYLTSSNNNTVQGNYIGVDKTGTVALTSGRGISIEVGSGNLIGGAATGAGNVVGNWSDYGIILQSGSDNLIQGNLVGTDATGTVRLGGGNYGVADYSGAGTGNKIGGAADGEGNLIDGATISGVVLWFDTSTDLVVQGNRIGTDISGTMPLGNTEGILVYAGAGVIGGTAAGAGNRIAFNSSYGISFASVPHVPILGNEIYANGSLGISLSGTGTPTSNDTDDADSGANNLQNFPVISTVTIGPKTTVHVSGSLNSEANKTYRLEFFANASCDPSHNGEGKIFIGSTEVTTSPNDAAFGPLDIPVLADRHVITATATELVGAGLDPGSTSEFSVCSTQDTIFSDGVDGD